MSIDLNQLIEQRSEATNTDGDRIPFEFAGKSFSFRDPLMISDEEKDELAELTFDADVAEWYMGEEQYEKFISTEIEINGADGKKHKQHGSSSLFFLVFREYQRRVKDTDASGNPTPPGRSSRRAAARKQRKQR